MHRYNLHVKSTILEVFEDEFTLAGASNCPPATNDNGEKHSELKSDLFDLGVAFGGSVNLR